MNRENLFWVSNCSKAGKCSLVINLNLSSIIIHYTLLLFPLTYLLDILQHLILFFFQKRFQMDPIHVFQLIKMKKDNISANSSLTRFISISLDCSLDFHKKVHLIPQLQLKLQSQDFWNHEIAPIYHL